MADKKITDLDALTTVAAADVVAIVDDPSGTPVTKKITKANLVKEIAISDLANGTDGELITWDASAVAAAVAAGTSGQVLTSNGAGTAPTFQAAAGGKAHVIGFENSPMSSDFTTTSTSFVDITGYSGSVVTSVTSSIMAWVSMNLQNTAVQFVITQLVIDGSDSGLAKSVAGANNQGITQAITGVKTGVAAATVKALVQMKTASDTAQCNDTFDNITILAIEE